MKFLLPLFACLLPLSSAQPHEGAPQSAINQREQRMEWWRDAKFGMFIHYGLYSGLAGEINGKVVTGCVEWIQQYSGTNTESYFKQALPKFSYQSGKATEWAKLAHEAGCGYAVMTTRHHEGFNLYDTSGISDWSSVKNNGVDIVKEFAEATQKLGLKTGYYFSIIDWNHPDYDPTGTDISYPAGNLEDVKKGTRKLGQHERYKEHLHQLFERLVSRYPTDIVWWDFSSLPFQGDKAWGATRLMSTLYKHHPMAVQNNRLFCLGQSMNPKEFRVTPHRMGDFTTPEHYIPAQGVPGDWEVCNTLNGTWGYSAHNQKWAEPKQVVRDLIDIVSRGGNYLLNIGPMPDGSIPEPSIRIFKAIGAWLKPNAEAIYGTKASPFTTEFKWGRVTRKGDGVLYAIVYEMPANGLLELPCEFATGVQAAPLLAPSTKLGVKQVGKVTQIDISAFKLDPTATVVKIEGSYRL